MMNGKAFSAVAVFTLSAGIFASSIVQAEQDFTRYTNEELVQQRSQVQNMSEGDQIRYQQEMQKRFRIMNQEERKFLQQNTQEPQLRERINENNVHGQGDLKRERQRIENSNNNGYGQGFGSRHGVIGGRSR